jgi:hypothetical protein
MLDDGMRSGVTPKLIGWDTKTDKLHRVIYLPAPIAPKDSFVNDFTVDSRQIGSSLLIRQAARMQRLSWWIWRRAPPGEC